MEAENAVYKERGRKEGIVPEDDPEREPDLPLSCEQDGSGTYEYTDGYGQAV